jgi:hypothetical protein
MKHADAAAVCFALAHRQSTSKGLRKIPPPIPTIPEITPMPAPIGKATERLGPVDATT